ncbi:MAG TPA: PAS domain S-box protein [Terriglobales bacterium]|nr:PAS domain S-box protein [Terriglobales bacterium]
MKAAGTQHRTKARPPSAGEERYRSLFQQFPDPVFLVDRESLRFLDCNQAAVRRYGYSRDEFLRMTVLDLHPEDEQDKVRQRVHGTLDGASAEFRHVTKDGRRLLVEVTSADVKSDGRPCRLATVHDISERKRIEEALRLSEQRAQEIVESNNDAVFTHDLQGRFTSINEAALRLFGYTREEALAGQADNVVAPEHREMAHQALQRKLAGELAQTPYEIDALTKDGRRLTLEMTTRLIFENGRPVGVQGVARDITDRRRAEAALRESEPRFEQFAEAAPSSIFILQGDHFTWVNAASTGLTGYSRDELLRMNFRELVHPDFREFIAARTQARLRGEATPSRYLLKFLHKDGSTRWLDLTASLVTYRGAPAVLGTAFDATERKLAGDDLQIQKAHLEQLIESAPEAIVVLDMARNISRVNREFTRLFGYTAGEAVGRDVDELIVPPELRDEALGLTQQVLEGRAFSRETVRQRKDGMRVEVSILGTPVSVGGGQVAYYAIYRDITERKRAEALQSALYRIAETASSAEDLQQLYASIHGILGELMYAKNCYIALYDAASGMVSFPYFVDEKDPPFPPHKFRKGLTEYVLRSGQPLLATADALADLTRRGEVERAGAPSQDWMGIPLKEGETAFGALVLQSYEPQVRYGEKEKEILTFVSQQIASAIVHKRSQEAIRQSESIFRAVAETAATLIYIFDGTRFLYVNPTCEAITGYSREELLSLPDPWTLVHPDFREESKRRAWARLRDEPTPSRYEFKILNQQGEERWLDFAASRIEFAGRTVVLGTAVDITERKRAEVLQGALYRIASLASTTGNLEDLYRSIHRIVGELMHAHNFYIALADFATQTIEFPYFMDEVDKEPPEQPLAIGRGLTGYVLRTGEPLLASPEVFEKLLASGEVESVGAPSLDWLGVPLKKGGTTFGVLVVQSYTENVRYGEKEKEILTFVSQQVASAIEHKRGETALQLSEARYRSLFERNMAGVFRSTLEGRLLDCNQAFAQMFGYTREELFNMATHALYPGGKAERDSRLGDLRQARQYSNYELCYRRKDGSLMWAIQNMALLHDEHGNEIVEGTMVDITERHLLEEQLRQAQKMEAVGRLAGGVAHDFNNLLTVIKGYSELMLKELKDTDPMRAEVEEVQKAADRAASLTNQLLAFSRQQVLEPRVLDLNTVLSNMEKLLRRLLGEDVDLVTVLDPAIGRVKADPGQVEQVIMNLAVNARDAMPKGGKLTLETSNVVLDKDYAREHVAVKPGAYVVISVSDTGVGMDADTCARVFEPFFTTKEQGKGTGLGLSTVYGIIKQSGGYIWVYSEVGLGTTFKVYLPRVDQPAEHIPDRGSSRTQRGNETILLVEDEDGVRALVHEVLRKNGYTVLQARHGGEALLLCERHAGTIHLLLTDVVLAQMSGHELALRLSALRPDMKVLYMSGYTDEAIVHHGVLEPGTAFLQKPFTTEALARKVRAVLDTQKRA